MSKRPRRQAAVIAEAKLHELEPVVIDVPTSELFPKRNKKRKTKESTKPISNCTDLVSPKNSDRLGSDSESSDNEVSTDLKDQIMKKITCQVNNFFKNANCSDDEDDDIIQIPTSSTNVPTKTTVTPKSLYVLSDSDEGDDSSVLFVSNSSNQVEEVSQECKQNSDSVDSEKKDPACEEKELMDIVHQILDTDNEEPEINVSNSEPDNWNKLQNKVNEVMESINSIISTIDDVKTKPKEETSPVKNKPTCPVCLEVLGETITAGTTLCGHIFCMSCIQEVAKTTKKCPTCRKIVTKNKIHKIFL